MSTPLAEYLRALIRSRALFPSRPGWGRSSSSAARLLHRSSPPAWAAAATSTPASAWDMSSRHSPGRTVLRGVGGSGPPGPLSPHRKRGGNDGALARDIPTCARCERPDFYDTLTYRMEEPLEAVRLAQQQTPTDFADRLEYTAGPVPCGIFFANELLDAIPFRRVTWTGSAWMETQASLWRGRNSPWTTVPLTDYAATARLATLDRRIPRRLHHRGNRRAWPLRCWPQPDWSVRPVVLYRLRIPCGHLL